jgi:hypothetical protein
VQAPPQLRPQLAARLHDAVGAAFVAGFREVMLLSAGLALAGAVAAAALVRAPARD